MTQVQERRQPSTEKRQRVRARGEIAIDRQGLTHLHQSGSAKIRLPRATGGVFEAVLMNTAGGLTGDDQLDWQARAGGESALSLTTAASEKLYRTHGPVARQVTSLRVDRDALLAWLPQETIVFDGSALARRLEVDLQPGARLLACESFIFGRRAMGETLERIALRDDWRVRHDGKLLHAEAFRYEGAWSSNALRSSITRGFGACATVLYCSDLPEEPLEHKASVARRCIDDSECAAISRLPGRLVARLLAPSSLELRQILIPLLASLEPDITLPRVWTV